MNQRDTISEARAQRLNAQERSLYESFRSMGMSPAAALSATAGRDGSLSSTDRFDTLTEAFEGMGLSADAARFAATGRRSTEYEARRVLNETDEPAPTRRTPGAGNADTPDGQRLLDLMGEGHSIQEAQELIERGPPATRRVTETGRTRRVTVRESQRSGGTDALAARVAELERGGMTFLDALHEAERQIGLAR